jgi:type I restriction-modification system DNA methylase subunit
MGEKNSDGGQFFTPREVIRGMVHILNPQAGETVYDPCCGTGGFLAVAFEHINRNLGDAPASNVLDTLNHDTFFGREKENLVFPIALANLILHGIDQPNLWHGNTLTNRPTYPGLFEQAPPTFDVILTNPPFGGKEGTDAQKNYSFETGSTQVLFLQHIWPTLNCRWMAKQASGAALCWMKACCSVPMKALLSRPNASWSTNVICGALSVFPAVCFQRREPVLKPICCFLPG